LDRRLGGRAAGLVEAVAENTLLGSPTSGTVAKVHVKVWDPVKAGDPILTLDDRDLRAQRAVQKVAIEAAAATAERAADAARRWTGLKDSGAVAAGDLVSYQMAAKEASARLALAQAQLEQTDVLLDRLVLRSPIAATVLQVGVRAGEFVTAGAKAPVVLGDISRLQIRCDVDEQLATRMREGLPAKGYLKGESSLAGAKDRSIPLKFVRIEPFVIPKASLTGASVERVDTRVLQVIYQFDRPTGRALFVGQQMDVYIDAPQDAPGK
ncbi:MAG: efflux RND transporter periplasmic adaptor subunit, partial [Verrucomicrobiota bacterium]